MSERLKPCPFCDGEPRYKNDETAGPTAFIIYCTKCMSSSQIRHSFTLEGMDKKLVELWNRRVTNSKEVGE